MKKLFSSFLALGTVASFAACGKQEAKAEASEDTTKTDSTETTDSPKSTVKKGTALKGTYKIGYTGSDFTAEKTGKELETVITSYTQDIKDPSGKTGENYYKLPSGLFLARSESNWRKEDTAGTELSDSSKLASLNLDSLFIAVTDDKQNSSDVYKTVVEKKEFGDSHLYFIGEKAESQNGSSSKKFAGDKISSATFNKYAAAYTGGFQAAVGAIKYSGSEGEYEETDVTFLIGSITESEYKKKAFAFRRGVEAAAAHPEYSKYLKVKFVNKTVDQGSSKKLYRDVSDWKAKNDKKPKIYEFTSSDVFTEADRRVVYIAGTTAEDWRGDHANANKNLAKETFKENDNVGLIGAIFKYEDLPSTTGKSAEDLKTKSYTRGIWVVLDKVSVNNSGISEADNSVTSNADEKHYLVHIADSSGGNNAQGKVSFERHGEDIKFYGALGSESAGTEGYVKSALKGQYMGGPNYMIGKHTIFGAPLDLSAITITTTKTTDIEKKFDRLDTLGADQVNSVWARSSGSNDTKEKAKARYTKSYSRAVEKELVEEELTKEASWIK